jgi:hypothetical protein
MRVWVLGLLAACSTAPPRGALEQAFEAAATRNGVPRDLMVAIAAVEGGLDMPARREVNPDSHVPVAGPLQLRHGAFDSLKRGAELMGTSELALRQDRDLAIEASARLLAELPHGGDLASWNEALETLSGYFDDAHKKHYAHRVFALLARGGTFGGIRVPAYELPPHLTLDLSESIELQNDSELPGAEWIPTPSANNGARGAAATR